MQHTWRFALPATRISSRIYGGGFVAKTTSDARLYRVHRVCSTVWRARTVEKSQEIAKRNQEHRSGRCVRLVHRPEGFGRTDGGWAEIIK